MHLLFEGQQDSREICADCYVKSPNNFSQRNIRQVIDIHRVDDTVFKNILKNIVRAKKEEVANTGYILLGLVYCCTLTRLGMKSEEIRNIINKGLI